MADLYTLPAKGAEFTTFCGGNLGGEHETCLAVAEIPGATGAYILHDDKPEGVGRELRATAAELDAFVRGWAALRGLAF
ncbi:DUF397 domain-containing protein [Streptomyces sp. RPT161]|uniref:DUF397 domain-containing protein n=1 Tax=Streptomyces sp. RPT161 TaxID=3015993 RepID=UPI0022B8BAB1|nr:DUF397 domain-containing protein [Streptomyces sp. RPT161]